MPGITLDFALALWIILLLTAASFVAAFYFYRRTIPPVSPARRALLIALRTLGIALIVLLLGEPVLHVRFTHTTPPVLAVLADNSRSMRIVDHTGDRAATLNHAIHDPVLTRIAGRADVRYFTFGTRLRPWNAAAGDSLPLNEGATDLSDALHRLATEKERSHIDAALLITDGTFTIGRDPVHDADQLDLPLFTVGIGDTTEQKDLLVTRIAANELVYAESKAPVNVTVKSSGFGGERVEVTLNEGSRVLDRASLTLEPGTREYPVDLTYTPEGEGVKRYTVRVSTLPGEVTTANNRRGFTARVLRSKLRVLVVGGLPSPDVSVVRQTIGEERNFSVLSFTGNTRGGFYEGQLTRTVIDSADCIVLVGFPTAATPPALVQYMASRFTEARTPLLFVDGKHVDYNRARPIGEALPFIVSSRTPTEQMVSIQPAEDQRENPILNAGEGTTGWSNLPPVFRLIGIYTAKPGAVMLGSVKGQAGALREPLLVVRSAARQKSLAVLAYNIWRWRLMAQGAPETSTLFSSFLVNAVKWLTTPEDQRPVRVSPVQDAISQGQPVEFTGQVYNQGTQPVDNAEVKVVARQNDMTYETDLHPLGNGRYEGSMEGLPEGDYTFRATGSLNGTSLGEDNGRFSVGEQDLEFQDTRMNSTLLRQLAFRTGGMYLPPERIGALDSLLASRPSFSQRTIAHASDVELWHWQWLLAGIIAIFAAEWIVRKTSGML